MFKECPCFIGWQFLNAVTWPSQKTLLMPEINDCNLAQWPGSENSFFLGPRISPLLRDDSTVRLHISIDWLSHTFTIIYTCIIMTRGTTDSLSEYLLLRTSLKLHNYCIHRSTTGIFSMQEWHLFQERFPNRSLYPSITNTTIQLSQ